jgi:hypothetical protein
MIERTNKHGVIRLFSKARQQYLISNDIGDVELETEKSINGADNWLVEERENGFLIRSFNTQRVLVATGKGSVSTVPPGTVVHGNTRWHLEPKIPRQINKEKLQKVGGAVAIGIIGTVATPFVIGGAIGALGVAQVGVAGNIAIGSVRAVEAINTITRVTLSSSQLVIRQSSLLSSDARLCIVEDENAGNGLKRPFCDWRSW